jgi:predicted transcriptional regulator of viral defense system
MAPSAPAQYHVILKRDGQLVESFETSEKKHVLKKLLPGRYRFEVIARGLRGEYELSPLTETWTVQSESAVPAPQLKKIEVRQ